MKIRHKIESNKKLKIRKLHKTAGQAWFCGRLLFKITRFYVIIFLYSKGRKVNIVKKYINENRDFG